MMMVVMPVGRETGVGDGCVKGAKRWGQDDEEKDDWMMVVLPAVTFAPASLREILVAPFSWKWASNRCRPSPFRNAC